MFKNRYRVKQIHWGIAISYQPQCWRWWFPIWCDITSSSCSSAFEAEKAIGVHRDPVIYQVNA